MQSNKRILNVLMHQIWAFPRSYGITDIPPAMAQFSVFAKTVNNALTYGCDAMAQPKWLEKVKGEIASKLPTTLPEGKTVFKSDSLAEPKLSGKFRKYSTTAQTQDGRTVNLSLSPTLLGRVLEVIEAGAPLFAITKQGAGIDTNYTVEAVAK
jgi:hypothetical protein